ncbi:response regulator [Halalkalibaculum sp. DA3122]|uniref:response regulator n=1 Tax=unclassified Halalkalibaculum TaxID=2964617 RepID=UPI00375468CF
MSATAAKKILIVEDDMIISMVLERMIEKLNHQIVDTITTGKGAIKAALTTSPDLILMDIQLKDDTDGIDAMREIKKDRDIPVIYITGNSDLYNQKRAKQLGYLKYMIKPVRMDDLKEAISNYFTGN